MEHTYIAIDLKSFYASVECIERHLDPMDVNLVVADATRTEKTICLAVSPSLKEYGIPGRARLFEVIQKIKRVNQQRRQRCPYVIGESYKNSILSSHPEYQLSYIIAKPRMALYLEWSTRIHQVYLKYVAPEDIHVYSIDEVFIDATHYLKTYQMSGEELTRTIIKDIYETTGMIATGGIGTNLYLAKVAMDIVAKHCPPDENGVRVAKLDEIEYRRLLWEHQPLTDFWRVGKGYEKRLKELGLYTMKDIAKCSIGTGPKYNEDLLYDTFGIQAELLIDHAWGKESCTMKDIKAYQPDHHSIGIGQVLNHPYSFEKGRIIVKEMIDSLALQLVEKNLVSKELVINIGYDKDNKNYQGDYMSNRYGIKVPKQAHGIIKLDRYTSSSKLMKKEAMMWYDRQVNSHLMIRRINMSALDVVEEKKIKDMTYHQQLSLFSNDEHSKEKEQDQKIKLEKEKRLQQATLALKNKYGKNAVLKVLDLEEDATAKERNETIGGHKA